MPPDEITDHQPGEDHRQHSADNWTGRHGDAAAVSIRFLDFERRRRRSFRSYGMQPKEFGGGGAAAAGPARPLVLAFRPVDEPAIDGCRRSERPCPLWWQPKWKRVRPHCRAIKSVQRAGAAHWLPFPPHWLIAVVDRATSSTHKRTAHWTLFKSSHQHYQSQRRRPKTKTKARK